MNIEFHYYITYILAKSAGFSKEDVQIIAYASQYTDDNNTEFAIDKGKPNEYKNYISQTYDILKPQKERMKIYPCFHFLPGDYTNESTKRTDNRTHTFNTTANSKNANILMDAALQTDDPYRIGICTHCYADTWAHQNFIGWDDDFNSISGILEALIPNIGHADARYQPDIPNLLWEDKRLIQNNRNINNKLRFLDAAKNIFSKFFHHVDVKATAEIIATEWNNLEDKISIAMGKESNTEKREDAERIERYAVIAKDISEYDKELWFNEAIKKQGLSKKSNFQNSYWYKFQEAVKAHQQFAFMTIYKQIAEIWLSGSSEQIN
jgi:hypothetical protein